MTAEWLSRHLYAHRGLHGGADVPENSLAAFAAAASAGYGIELDVQAAACGAPVVFHDFGLQRLTAALGPLAARRASELGRLKLGGSDETIPTLASVLELIAGRAPLLIEIKVPKRGRIGKLEAQISDLLDAYNGPFAVQSFNPESMAWFADNAPGLTRGQIAADFISRPEPGMAWAQRLAWSKLWSSSLSRPHFISYHIQSLPCPVTRGVRRARVPLICWTVRTEAQRVRAEQNASSYIFEGMLPPAAQSR